MARVHLDPLDYAAAADLFRATANTALDYYDAADAQLRKFGKMAGDDNGGQEFADAYDGAAQVMLQSLHDIAVAASALDRGLMSTGRVHYQTEQYAAGLVVDDGPFVVRPPIVDICVAAPPSAYGGPPEPGIIDVIRDLFALIWPNADIALMKQAGRAWVGISDDFTALAQQLRRAVSPLSGTVSGEVDAIGEKVDDLASGIDELAASAQEISEVCEGYAQDVEDAHNEILPMLGQLVAEIAIGAGLSIALSFVTFGGAAAVGAAAIAIRAAAVAARVGSVLFRVLSTAGRVAMRLRNVATRLTSVARRFRRLTQVGIEITSSTGSAVGVEAMFNGKDANYLAAAVGGFVGGGAAGGITAALVSRTASLSARVGAGALAGGVGGGIGAVGDNLVRFGSVDVKSVVFGAALGTAGGSIGGVPKADGGSSGNSSSGGGSAKTPDIDLPASTDLDVDLDGMPGDLGVVPDATPGDSTPGSNPGGSTPGSSIGTLPSTIVAPDASLVDLGPGRPPTGGDGPVSTTPDVEATTTPDVDATTTPDVDATTTPDVDASTTPDASHSPDAATASGDSPATTPGDTPDGDPASDGPPAGPDADTQARIDHLHSIVDATNADGSPRHEPWIRRLFSGEIFNLQNHHRYPINELHVTQDGKSSYNRIDSIRPGEEIVSRKDTQLDDVQPQTVRNYLDEVLRKYGPDRADVTVADTPSNRQSLLDAGLDPDSVIGKPLQGDPILEVPRQDSPPRIADLEYAANMDPPVTVRDAFGTIWSAVDGSVVETRVDGTQIVHPTVGGDGS